MRPKIALSGFSVFILRIIEVQNFHMCDGGNEVFYHKKTFRGLVKNGIIHIIASVFALLLIQKLSAITSFSLSE